MICSEAVSLIKRWEGCKLKAYLCPAGVWTIGYGTTRDWDGSGISPSMIITQDDAEALFLRDLPQYESKVRSLVQSGSEWQIGALTSFSYNLGSTALAISSLLTFHNTGLYERAALEFPKWKFCRNKYGNKVANDGLLRRRLAEQELYLSGVDGNEN